MINSVYPINKGINRSIEFRGLRAQYIWYFGAGVMALLILFSLLYIVGVNALICVGTVLIGGTFLVVYIYRLSDRYGEHGMMKAAARLRVPKVVRVCSREIYLLLKETKS